MTTVNVPTKPIVCSNLTRTGWTALAGGTPVKSPWSGQTIGTIGTSRLADVDTAVQGAQAAFLEWRQIPIKERSEYLLKFRNQLRHDISEIAHVAAAECGKTFAEAKAGIEKGLEVIDFALSIQNMDVGGAVEVSRGVQCAYRREPLGVVLGITPFNFPAMVPLWMYPIAMTLGNAFILKPSEKVPLTSQLIGKLWEATGIPKGVFTVVNGDRDVVGPLIDHPLVQAVAFVGSTPAAKAVYLRATSHGKRCLALGGAKNQLILVPDADPEVAVPGIVNSFTGCAGQRCMAASLLLGVGNVDKIIDQVAHAATRLKLGTDMGAIIDPVARQRIVDAIGRAEKDGAKIVVDGRRTPPPPGMEGGNWLGATVIDHAKPEMECATTEIFGPVLTIVRCANLTEAMKLEQKNPYGNATSVFTTQGAVADRVARESTAGMIGVNVGVPVPREPFSFGGTKQSKFGQGDITGQSSLDFWSNRKKVTMKWVNQSDNNWMS
jgi:malonate-semialdehyde dehydrogenase (acetylating)/methylmalonate-semialdehyde dehydrogenase